MPSTWNKSVSFFRETVYYDLIKRALHTAEIPSSLEPVDISRDDNLKKVHMQSGNNNHCSWSHGHRLAWDTSVLESIPLKVALSGIF